MDDDHEDRRSPESWRRHARLLDALHAAVEQAERLDPLTDSAALGRLLDALARAVLECTGLLTVSQTQVDPVPPAGGGRGPARPVARTQGPGRIAPPRLSGGHPMPAALSRLITHPGLPVLVRGALCLVSLAAGQDRTAEAASDVPSGGQGASHPRVSRLRRGQAGSGVARGITVLAILGLMAWAPLDPEGFSRAMTAYAAMPEWLAASVVGLLALVIAGRPRGGGQGLLPPADPSGPEEKTPALSPAASHATPALAVAPSDAAVSAADKKGPVSGESDHSKKE